MAWVSWVGAVGNAIELVGFGILAWELSQTNRSSIADAKAMVSEVNAFERMEVWDLEPNDPPGTPTVRLIGGKLGLVLDKVTTSLVALEGSWKLIVRGVWITAIGAGLQTFSAFWQAVFPT